jgi:hypothetical protein
MSVHSNLMPRVARGRRGSRAWRAARRRHDRPRLAQHADDQVAQAGRDAGAGTGAKLGGVLGEGDVAEVMQCLDGPVPAEQVSEVGLACSNNDAVNVLPCATCAYLDTRFSELRCPYQDDAGESYDLNHE